MEGMAQTDAPARQNQPNNHLERVREGERERKKQEKKKTQTVLSKDHMNVYLILVWIK